MSASTIAEQRRRNILAEVDGSGAAGITPEIVAERLDIGIGSARAQLRSLATMRRLVSVEIGDERVYRSADHGIAPADADGAKTNVERAIVATIREAPEPPTADQVAAAADVHWAVNPILGALCRRGVLRVLPRSSERERARYEVAR